MNNEKRIQENLRQANQDKAALRIEIANLKHKLNKCNEDKKTLKETHTKLEQYIEDINKKPVENDGFIIKQSKMNDNEQF